MKKSVNFNGLTAQGRAGEREMNTSELWKRYEELDSVASGLHEIWMEVSDESSRLHEKFMATHREYVEAQMVARVAYEQWRESVGLLPLPRVQ